jgi:hypothetical protein
MVTGRAEYQSNDVARATFCIHFFTHCGIFDARDCLF